MAASTRSSRPASRPRLRRFVVVILAVVAVAAVVEGFLRLFPDPLPYPVRERLGIGRTIARRMRETHKDDALLGYRMIPDASFRVRPVAPGDPPEWRLRTDRNGFRHPCDPVEADVVVLGDDMTLGPGVPADRVFPILLGQRLTVPAASLATLGYAPAQSVRALRRYGLIGRPRIVLFAVSQDDFLDSVRFQSWIEQGAATPYLDHAAPPSTAPPTGSPTAAIGRAFTAVTARSALCGLVSHQLGPRFGGAPRRGVLGCHVGGHAVVLDPDTFAWTDGTSDAVRAGVRHLCRALAEAATLARTRQCRLVVVNMPTREQVMAHRIPADALDAFPEARDSRADLVAAAAAVEGLPLVDLALPLRNAVADGIIPFFPGRGILNEEGHRVVADALAAHPAVRGALSTGR